MTEKKIRDEKFTVEKNRKTADMTYALTLSGNTEGLRPGMFVELGLPGFYLRRPISVSSFSEGRLDLIYKVVGRGTDYMTGLKAGDVIDVLGPLGNGFDTDVSPVSPLLIGAGAGVAPMLALAAELYMQGKKPNALLGFNKKDDIFLLDELSALCGRVAVTTMDGSYGIRGLATDAKEEFGDVSYYYACGPMPMLKAVSEAFAADGQMSLEARMGCGFGGCMGCSIMTKSGSRRVCKEGPVFPKEEIIW